MNTIQSLASLPSNQFANSLPPESLQNAKSDTALRQAFDAFVGETFFGQMLSAMRKTVDKPAYFHGGQAEEVFQQQLDQLMVERVAEASATTITGPMFELFMLRRPG